MIYAYHSLGPDNLITLDSLTPEKLGSSTVMLIPEYVDADKFDVSYMTMSRYLYVRIQYTVYKTGYQLGSVCL